MLEIVVNYIQNYFINFSCRIFELVSNISSGVTFTSFLSNVAFLAAAMYKIDVVSIEIYWFDFYILCNFLLFLLSDPKELNDIGFNFFFALTCINCGVMWTYILSYSATLASFAVAGIGNIVYNCSWYNYPLSVRKYMILLIARSQRQVYLTGFKLFPCSLEGEFN